MFSYKIFRQGDDILLAISDSDIIGKTFRKNNVEVRVGEDFYSDRFCDEKKVTDLIKNATIVNAIGKDIIKLMLKEKFIEKENILEIDGVPHAQIITLK